MSNLIDNEDPLDDNHIPETVIDRIEEFRTLATALDSDQPRHLYCYGPRGAGKTLLIRKALDTLPPDRTPCYCSGTQYNTQYQVLTHLLETLTDEEIGDGYHTSQLQDRVADEIESSSAVLVLDEFDFLLMEDGNDLLYFLSRTVSPDELQIVTISANYPELADVVDGRTFSTLQPEPVTFGHYEPKEVYRILEERARAAFRREPFPHEALSYIAAQVTNVRFGLCWLAEAASTTEELTEDHAIAMRPQAAERYRDCLLTEFTPHHHLLVEAINYLTADTEMTHSGRVYEEYEQLCGAVDVDSMTNRRVSDYLKHLELLGIVEADYHYGGLEGKTRELRLQEF